MTTPVESPLKRLGDLHKKITALKDEIEVRQCEIKIAQKRLTKVKSRLATAMELLKIQTKKHDEHETN